MSRRAEARLWIAQRASAVVLAVCVLVHLVVIVHAVRGGLSAAQVLGRTRGSFGWGAFYSVFVVAAAIHGAIGLRGVAAEWLGFRGRPAEWTMAAIAAALLALGLRGVFAVVAA